MVKTSRNAKKAKNGEKKQINNRISGQTKVKLSRHTACR
nr:MAG TPA: hypothetical protein [Caudoviricetes sp.]